MARRKTTGRLQRLLLAVSATASMASALFIPPASTGTEIHDIGCVHMPIYHSDNDKELGKKRAVLVPGVQRFDVAYYTKLSFGTPPQEALLHIDTGSFETWVNPTCSSTYDADFCRQAGFFNTSTSSSVRILGTNTTLRYGIGGANISYVKDTVGIPGTNMRMIDVQFGVATSSDTQATGILGIGHGQGATIPYRNFIDELFLQNITKTKAFSVALGGKDEKQGIVVFGGVDTSKFSGPLAKLPITPASQSPDGVARYWVGMESVTLNPPSLKTKTYNNSKMQVFLDTGSTLTLLPPELVRSIAADFGSNTEDPAGYWPVSCGLVAVNGTLDFAFRGVTIRVPYRELIRQAGDTCVLGLTGRSNFVLLGDTFLRSAYVVFDQDSNSIWMTQYANCGATPAALESVSSLASLTGLCARQAGASVVAPTNTAGGATVGAGSAPGTLVDPGVTTVVGASGLSGRPRVERALVATGLVAFFAVAFL